MAAQCPSARPVPHGPIPTRLLLVLALGLILPLAPGQPARAESRSPLAIEEVVASPAGTLNPGDALVVSARATRGATATFDVGDIAHGLPMSEISPGRYRGILLASHALQAPHSQVVVHLGLGNLEVTRTAPTTVAFASLPPSTRPWVHITFPVKEQNVPPVFTVTGRTSADARVEVKATALERYVLGLDSVRDHATATAHRQANADGNFAVPLDLGVVQAGDVIRIEVRSCSPLGTSAWTRYEVRVSNYP